jgi:hypothetical protein
MIRPRVLAVACSFFAFTACGTEPSAPVRSASASPSVVHDDVVTPNPDGTCRSGYSVANGICVPN